MIKLATLILDILGPITVFLYLYMLYYLWAKKVILFSQLLFYPFWPQLVFRFRDITKKEKGKISNIYFLFFCSLSALIVSVFLIFIPEMKDMPIPAMVFVGLALFLILPIVVNIFFLMSKEKYY